jgi:RNA polymerase sigma factor (sigma-70 family)
LNNSIAFSQIRSIHEHPESSIEHQKNLFSTNTSTPSSIILIDGQTPNRAGYRKVNEISVDFVVEMDHATNEYLPESNLLDVFSTELGRLRRIIAGMGLSASDGEDVLQDVSIRALKQCRAGSRTAVSSRENSVKWLIKVTVNRCLMEHRSRRTFQTHANKILKKQEQAGKASKGADEKAIVAEELEIVRESLQELNDALLASMVLRYFCDFNSKEIGEILALSPSAVRSRLREARITLAKRLLERGVKP